MVTKEFWKSKTFWFNVLTATAELTAVLPVPPGTALIVASVVNVALRFVTDQPVSLKARY